MLVKVAAAFAVMTSCWLVVPVTTAVATYEPEGAGIAAPRAARCTITGTARGDVLRGTPRKDVICGGRGNDRVVGRGGDDVLRGGPGNDVLTGSAGNDVLLGEAGRDELRGVDGAGYRDRIVCGGGRDRAAVDRVDVVQRGCEALERDDAPTALALAPATVAEDQPAGSPVGRLSATDPDRGETHRFALVPGEGATDNGAFRVEGAQLVTAQSLDHESTPQLQVRLRATDPTGLSVDRSLTVVVTDADDPATAVDDEADLDEDSAATPIDVLANDTDVDAGPRAVASVTQPVHGTATVTGAGTGLTYRPAPDHCGTAAAADVFTYTLAPGGSTATVRVDVACVDDEPVAVDDSATVAEDSGATSVDVLANDIDRDGDPLTVGSVTLPTAGEVVITGGGTGLTYRPLADTCTAEGTPDTFTYTLADGASAAVAVDVTCHPDEPVLTQPDAEPLTYTEDSPSEDHELVLAPALTAVDADGDDLTGATVSVAPVTTGDALAFVDQPGIDGSYDAATGRLTLEGSATVAAYEAALRTVTYRTTSDHPDTAQRTVSFRVEDAAGEVSDPATRTVDLVRVNDAPSFVMGPDQTDVFNQDVDGSAMGYEVDGWATEISAGPGEAGQALEFEVTADDATLFTVPPAVSADGVLTYTPDPTRAGTATVTVMLKDDGGTAAGGDDTSADHSFTITTMAPGPAIDSVSPSPLVPGGTATLTGRLLGPTAAGNAVTIGGATAPVTGASATSLTVTVPCVSSGSDVAVTATVDGVETNTVRHPLEVAERDLDVGESVILDDAAEVGCNELASADGPAKYVIAAYNADANRNANAPFRLSADGVDGASAPLDAQGDGEAETLTGPTAGDTAGDTASDTAPEAGHDDAHLVQPEWHAHDEAHQRLLQTNREQYELLRDEFGTEGVQRRRSIQADTVATDLPMSRSFRVPNLYAGDACNSFYVSSATRVYADGKLVIYEDDATPADFKAANNPVMADYYDRIGDQFNSDMEPIVRENFGDILLRDPVTDNNGVMIAFSTPRLNSSFPGVAGFVASCDQFPNDDTSAPGAGGPYTGSGINGASNFGEYFYLYQPAVVGTGYSRGNTPDSWYRTVRATFIHESKHVASQAARAAKDAPYEVGWLEEGTARIAEELWARKSIYDVPWKGNTGYGSAASPRGIYCDVRPGWSECAGPRQPASAMQRHFSTLHTFLYAANSRLLSPFGATASDSGSYYYAISWSLIRYAIDRYGASDADFLTALTDSTSTGAANLVERSGVPLERLLGGWALALAVDDYPGMTTPSADVQIPTWNFRGIYAGLHSDFPGTYPMAYPGPVGPDLSFGSLAPGDVTALRGGGVQLYHLSGTETQAQLLRLQGNGGGAPPPTLRLAIVRVQ